MVIHNFTSSFVESGCAPCRGCFGDSKQTVGTNTAFSSLRIIVPPSGNKVSMTTVPSAMPSRLYLSPNMTRSGGSSFFMLLKELLSLHMCVVAPESTIQVPLAAADRSCVVTRRWSLVCLDSVGLSDYFH